MTEEETIPFEINNAVQPGHCLIKKGSEITYVGRLAFAPEMAEGHTYFICEGDYRLMKTLAQKPEGMK